jgi:D-glycero-alpha-D-manno-heptose 1-phosphate guanylyltransferase
MSGTDEVVILAGGFGTRLRSVVSDVPKPLAPVRGRPFLAWLLDALAEQGLRRAVLATGYMGDRVAATLGSSWRSMELEYSREEQPLGTGGAIAKAVTLLHGDTFFVLNGDTWLSLDYADFDLRMRAACAPIGMALAEVVDASRYGAVNLEHERVAGFLEKGRGGPGYINAGVYRIERSLLADFPAQPCFSFETDVLLPAAARGAVAAYTHTGGFIDIGIPEDYQRAQVELLATRDAL